MDCWTLVYDRYAPEEEPTREALCVLGNGYFATRGAAAESSDDGLHYPGTYLAGCYNRLTSEIAGRQVENEDLVNLPNWLALSFRIDDGPWFDLAKAKILEFRQELDLRRGLLSRKLRFEDDAGRRCRLAERRLVHMESPHLAGLEIAFEAENWSGRITLRSALDGRVVNNGVARYRSLNNRHLEPLVAEHIDGDLSLLEVRTSQSQIRVALAARVRVYAGAEALAPHRSVIREAGYIAEDIALEVTQGSALRAEKIVALYSSRDRAISACGLEACNAVTRAPGFADLLRTQARVWAQLWSRFDLEIADHVEENAAPTLLILRLHIFHLLQTASPNIVHLDIGVPARGLHGEAYRGHIFWDELFIFPALNLRLPEVTRALLLYRYERLPEARANARAAGLRGALFPWQSGSNGREETQQIHLNPRSGHWSPDHSHLQRHVNVAIAYNVWQFYQVTGDRDFMTFYGAELMLEIARMLASLARYDETLQRYEIRGVVGPDEYHDGYPGVAAPGLDNNAYTNVMAAWTLCRALDALKTISYVRRREICERLEIDDDELALWERCSRRLRVDFLDGGIIGQFTGYDALKEFDWEGHRRKYGDIQRLDRILEAEGDSPNCYRLSKQADVLMLFYLFSAEELTALFEHLGYDFDPACIPANIDYYRRRTAHGSTLSRVVHAWVLSRSDREQSWQFFAEALSSDYRDIQGGTTAEGVHLGAMAGTIDLVLRCYTGIEPREGVLWLNPCLPNELSRLSLKVRYQGHGVRLEITRDRLRVKVSDHAEDGIQVGVANQVYRLKPGEVREFSLALDSAA